MNLNKIRLHFGAPSVCTGMGFFNKNFFYSFLGAILASLLLFIFSCSKDESNNEANKHTLIISKPKNGTVTSEPKGISCGSKGIACKAQVADGAKIKLIAAADAGYGLGIWGGACRGSDKKICELTMNADKIVSKIFNHTNEYTLTIDPKPTNGTVTSSPPGINCGDGNNGCDFSFDRDSEVTLTATAATNYEPGAWGKACASVTDAGANCTLTMNADKTVSKMFSIIRTLRVTRPDNGTITSSIGNINCGSGTGETACIFIFGHDSSVTLTAMAKTGYVTGAWGDNCKDTDAGASCTLTMDTPKTVSKTFSITQRTLTITTPINGTITSNVGGINCGESNTTCNASLDYGTTVILRATPAGGYLTGNWGGDDCSGAGNICNLAMTTNKTVSKLFTSTSGRTDTDMDGVGDPVDVDDDNDGLIEVHNLDMFNNIRHNADGTSYKMTSSGADDQSGAPTDVTVNCTTDDDGDGLYLCGYELVGDLDFAIDASYESLSVNNDWRPNDQADASGNAATPDNALNPGFVGIDGFAGIFEGNGYKISNLYSRGGGNRGLFRSTNSTASIRNLGIVDANLYGSGDANQLGALVGWNQGSISASSATGGTVNGGAGDDYIGALVGWNQGSISASYTIGSTAHGGADDDNVGGLVGRNAGSISASYATAGTANVDGGSGVFDIVGGLVGVNGEGNNKGSITASYTTTNVDGGGGGRSNIVGALVGGELSSIATGTIVASYGFGSTSNWAVLIRAGTPPGGATVNNLDLSSAGSEWNLAAKKTKGAWDFGNTSQPPVLRYADYDGAAGIDYCALFPVKIPGTNDDLICGTSLLPGQGR